ncbi:efflux RND transporter periplasmic adaptor subunit [Rhizobium sp. TRM95796]|uniref:efflux RND transporter periplasmic adaptor subunit n=1 Tax=Rhizobium sp. TRM95796 TaxID=2979862 RepID=UPI0021E8D767|nr:efflux RND transporter periplasmic adaptor subunit [Rhizobium sp. TRM95796]MCV3765802.1 efflux RND transporter periplasmic adaptor subunit [Rhizobium sp. TRM95796]
MPRKILFAVLIASSALAPTGFAWSAEPEVPADAPAAQNLPAIRVTEASMRELTDRVIASGTVQPVETVYVQAQVEGVRIEELRADVGDKVEAGQVLATLSAEALELQKQQFVANIAKTEAVGAQNEAQLAEARANEAEAVRQAERAQTLIRTKAVSQTQLEQLQSQAEAAKARTRAAEQTIAANKADLDVVRSQLADVELSLSRTEVKSPVAGVVTERNAKIGAIASAAGNPLFTLIRNGAIELQADVAEGDLLKLKQGQKVNIAIAGTSTNIQGVVRVIDPVVDQSSRLGKVKIAIADASLARAGMFASAEIIISERKVLSLPLTAVTAEKDGDYVRKVVDGVVDMTKVETGVADGDFVEIAAGLKDKDVVVEKAGVFVRDGDRIAPVRAQQTASN